MKKKGSNILHVEEQQKIGGIMWMLIVAVTSLVSCLQSSTCMLITSCIITALSKGYNASQCAKYLFLQPYLAKNRWTPKMMLVLNYKYNRSIVISADYRTMVIKHFFKKGYLN